jgi:protein phosphatase
MSLLILSDIHGNWPALEAVLQTEPTPGAIVFCGDAVDYGPQPVECVRWLARHAQYVVRGNHDNALSLQQDCQCLGMFREFSLATRAWHRTLLGRTELGFLHAMPKLSRFTWDNRRFLMAHATPQGDLFEYLDMERWRACVAGLNVAYVLLGHTHVQGMQVCDDVTVVNPGSVGLARDCPGQACYAVYAEGQVQLKRIPYDLDRTLAALRTSPLPPHIVQGLTAVLGQTTT